MPSNKAAILPSDLAPLTVTSVPYPSCPADSLIIAPSALAINPVDWGIQAMGRALFPFLTYPRTIGSDLAGSVISVGSSVSSFKPGDRVVAQAVNLQDPNGGAFQEHVSVLAKMASKIPESLSFEKACVLPMGLSTAANGLFTPEYLGLNPPSVEVKKTGKTVLIWGGSTSVGCNAIQLAVAAGYEVITTSSPRNFELVKSLGASLAFDYNSPTAVNDIVAAFKGKESAGAMAIGNPAAAGNGASAAEACIDIVDQVGGIKFVALAMVYDGKLPEGVKAKFVNGNEDWSNFYGDLVPKIIYGDFLPKALEKGTFVCMPESLVVGKGLEKVQEGFDLLKKGVSAKKVVVLL